MVSGCRGCELGREVEGLRRENGRLREENKRLREGLGMLWLVVLGVKPSKKMEKEQSDSSSGLKRGKLGPPRGHEGVSRERPNKIDRRVVLGLESCPHCRGGELRPLRPRFRYAEDLVPVRLVATEYEIKQYYCGSCGKIVYPVVPELVDNLHFGVRFLLYVTYLRFVLNLPYNKIARLLDDTYRAGVSEGTLVEYIKRAARVFGPEYERIKRQMKEMDRCHYDDTGQRVDGSNRWLWVFINQEAVLYHTSRSRGKKVVTEILGEDYSGVTVQDFYPSYDKAPGFKQKCWAHLLRDARTLAEKKEPPPQAEEFYKGLQRVYHEAKECAEKLNSERERKQAHRRFVKKLKNHAKQEYRHFEVKRLAKRIQKYRYELFTFLLTPGVEPTNNKAERALRPCVRQRKISGCHRTQEGATNRDIIMSVIGTMQLQGKNLLTNGQEHLLKTQA